MALPLMTTKATVQVEVLPCEVAVLIRGLPHLLLRRADLSGMQAYIKNVGVRKPLYFIEFTTRSGPIVADYDQRPLWETILRQLRAARIFENMQGAGPLPGSA